MLYCVPHRVSPAGRKIWSGRSAIAIGVEGRFGSDISKIDIIVSCRSYWIGPGNWLMSLLWYWLKYVQFRFWSWGRKLDDTAKPEKEDLSWFVNIFIRCFQR
jgi:hypothetical protein